jgi:hypothetical protein
MDATAASASLAGRVRVIAATRPVRPGGSGPGSNADCGGTCSNSHSTIAVSAAAVDAAAVDAATVDGASMDAAMVDAADPPDASDTTSSVRRSVSRNERCASDSDGKSGGQRDCGSM